MVIKSICFVVIFFFIGEFLPTDGHPVLSHPYIITPYLSLFHIADLKSILDTDKPDAELGTRLEQLGNDITPFISWSRSLTARMIANTNLAEQFVYRIIDAGLRLKDGRSNPAFRTSLSEELRTLAEVNNISFDEMKKLADDSKKIFDMAIEISEILKEKKENKD